MESITTLRNQLKRRYAASDWEQKRVQCFATHDWRCAVCGKDWYGKYPLQCHHLHYDTLWREVVQRDLIPLCKRHHPRGRLSLGQIRTWQKAYAWQKRLEWLVNFPFRALARWARSWRSGAGS